MVGEISIRPWFCDIVAAEIFATKYASDRSDLLP